MTYRAKATYASFRVGPDEVIGRHGIVWHEWTATVDAQYDIPRCLQKARGNEVALREVKHAADLGKGRAGALAVGCGNLQVSIRGFSLAMLCKGQPFAPTNVAQRHCTTP